MLCQFLHSANSFSFLSPAAPLRATPFIPTTQKGKENREKGRKEGFRSRLSAWAEGSGSRAGRGQMLLLCLPENKGAEDYSWIPSLFMERSNPRQFPCLAFKWQKPRAEGMQPLTARWAPARATWHCLWPPPGPMAQAGHCFLSALSLSPFSRRGN